MERTELQTFERIYHSCVIWHIHNYFKSIVLVNSPIESPEFITNLSESIKWKLEFLARGADDGKYVTECILRRLPSCNGPGNIVVKVKLIMEDSNENWLDDSTREICFYSDTTIAHRTWDVYDIEKNEAENTYFFTGNIRIICFIVQDIPLHYRLSDIDADLCALSEDLKILEMTGNFNDLRLKVDEETFSVHSVIVKVRSPKVGQILKDNPSLREIDLSGFCSVSVIEGLIVYWYSGSLEKLPKIPACTTAANIRLMEQFELIPHVDPECIKLNTIFETSKRSISWVIQDIPFCESLRHLERDIDNVYTCEDLPWKLLIYPKGSRGDANCFTMIIIEVGRFNTTYLELFLKDENDKEYFCTHKTVLNDNSGMYTYCNFMTHDEFANLSGILLKDNTLRIGCRMIYTTDYVEQNDEKFCFTEEFILNIKHPYINLANDMKLILKDEDSSDVSLKSGNKIFKVHSAILAARSRYFANLFRNPEYESGESNTITLDDVEPDDLDKILNYVYYAEKIVLNSDLALKLYPVFNKYEIMHLENLCSDYLQNNISVDNVCGIRELANEFNDTSLQQTAQQFAQEN